MGTAHNHTCQRKNTALTSKEIRDDLTVTLTLRFILKLNMSDHGLGLGDPVRLIKLPKFHIPMCLQFDEIFIVTEQRKSILKGILYLYRQSSQKILSTVLEFLFSANSHDNNKNDQNI